MHSSIYDESIASLSISPELSFISVSITFALCFYAGFSFFFTFAFCSSIIATIILWISSVMRRSWSFRMSSLPFFCKCWADRTSMAASSWIWRIVFPALRHSDADAKWEINCLIDIVRTFFLPTAAYKIVLVFCSWIISGGELVIKVVLAISCAIATKLTDETTPACKSLNTALMLISQAAIYSLSLCTMTLW